MADPLVAGQFGKAAFDAVGPLLLIGWAEVGPDLLRALTIANRSDEATPDEVKRMEALFADEPDAVGPTTPKLSGEGTKLADAPANDRSSVPASSIDDDLLEWARQEDKRHWHEHRRPISADILRRKLRVSAARSRLLVASIRADAQGHSANGEAARSWSVSQMITN